MTDRMLENDTFVTMLRHALTEGAAGLSDVPRLVKAVIRDERWRERRIKTGETIPFARFEEFVATAPLEGLGADLGLLRRICEEDKEALDLIDLAVQRPQGGSREPDSKIDNVNLAEQPDGNAAAAALRRLRKDRPDLHGQVIAGEISPHAAMVQAGFRRRTLSVPYDPCAAARAIRRHFQGERLERLLEALTQPE